MSLFISFAAGGSSTYVNMLDVGALSVRFREGVAAVV